MPFNVFMRFREKSLLPYLLKYNKLLFRLFSSTLILSMKKKPLLLQNLFSLLLRGQNDVNGFFIFNFIVNFTYSGVFNVKVGLSPSKKICVFA